MQKIFVWLLVSISFQTLAFCQSEELSFKNDFQILKKALLETHPSLYRFTPKIRFQEVFDSLENSINDQTKDLSFFQMVSQIESLIREGHSQVTLSPQLLKETQEKKLFPFQVWLDREKLILTQSHSPTYQKYIGAEILSINGKSRESILARLEKMTGKTAASNNAGILQILSLYNNFAYAYYLFVDQSQKFEITYLDQEGNKQSALIEGDNTQLKEETFPRYMEDSRPPVHFQIDEVKQVAILKITTFASWVVDYPPKKYYTFFRNCFKEMEEKSVQYLIIDVRDNRGGDGIIADKLLTYFLPQTFTSGRYIRAKTVDFSFTNSLPNSDKISFSEKEYEQRNGFYYLKKQENEALEPNYPQKKYFFKGKVYILANGGSRSATNTFLGLAKSYQIATIIGSESGGAFEDVDGYWRITFTLPYSKVKVSYPAWSLKINVKNGDPQRGVIPDYPISHPKEDILTNRDSDLEFMYQLIQKQP